MGDVIKGCPRTSNDTKTHLFLYQKWRKFKASRIHLLNNTFKEKMGNMLDMDNKF